MKLTSDSSRVATSQSRFPNLEAALAHWDQNANGWGDGDLFDFVEENLSPFSEDPRMKGLKAYMEQQEDWDGGDIVDYVMEIPRGPVAPDTPDNDPSNPFTGPSFQTDYEDNGHEDFLKDQELMNEEEMVRDPEYRRDNGMGPLEDEHF